MESIKVADEVWIGTALLHLAQPDRESFSTVEIVDRVFQEGLHLPLRPGVQIHVSQHCVANKRPNPGNYCMLYETARGQRRLYRHTDEAHPYRKGAKTVPARSDIPARYWYLLDWYATLYDHKMAQSGANWERDTSAQGAGLGRTSTGSSPYDGPAFTPAPPSPVNTRRLSAVSGRDEDGKYQEDRKDSSRGRVIMERLQIGPVEKAIRDRVSAGAVLSTPTGRGRFTVAEIGSKGPVLLLGEKKARTLIPWMALEGVPGFLSTRAWSVIGSVYDQGANPAALDGYMKRFVNRATAGWVACLLEAAGVVEIDRGSPARVRMRAGFVAPEVRA